MIFKDSNYNSVPIIALFAFAGYRILPALQRMVHLLDRFITSSLDALYEDYKFLNYKQKEELNTFSMHFVIKRFYYIEKC